MRDHNDRVWRVIAPFDLEGRGPVLAEFTSRTAAMAFGYAHVHREGFMVRAAILKRRRPMQGPTRSTRVDKSQRIPYIVA